MGEHKFNPVAQAAREAVRGRYLDIGEGYGLVGVGLQPLLHVDDETGEKSLALVLVARGGKPSQLMPSMDVVSVHLGEFARMPLADVYKGIDDALAKAREAGGQ